MNGLAAIGNLGWLAASLPEYRRFQRDSADLEATQRARLAQYLHDNADTAFGRQHGFADIRSFEEYAARVPVQGYDDFESWIERIATGEARVLTADPVRLFEPTSGSSGPAKLIPFTASLQQEIRQAVATWSSRNFLSEPGLMLGRGYWSLTPQMDLPERPDSKIPVGFDEDSAYLGGIAQWLINRTLVADPALRDVRDMDEFWHSTLLLLLRARDLRLISVWHPSYLELLFGRLQGSWDALLDELNDSDPCRAHALAAAGCDDASSIWPRLRLISCWTDGHAAATIPRLQALFPQAAIQPKGLIATEGVVTIPVGDQRPLAIRSHFFEFMDDGGSVCGSWQLEEGERYTVLLTTGGGLYRYQLGDQVEIDGYYRDTPTLRFCGRDDAVSDYRGEKISEEFAGDVIRKVLDQHQLAPGFAMLAVDDEQEKPMYVLYVETDSVIPEALGQQLEVELRANPHYELCVRLGQLNEAGVIRIEGNGFDIYSKRLSESGMRIGDIKPTPLSRQSGWRPFFTGRV